MKRFTETNKWRDAWFRRLSGSAKLLWYYLLDNCDQIGLADMDFDFASGDCGQPIKEKHLEELADHVQVIGNGKIFIPKFIHFQYGELSIACPPHKTILKMVESHGLSRDGLAYCYPSPRVEIPYKTRQDKNGQEEDKTGKEPEGWHPTLEQLRLGALFKRKPTTPFDDKELAAWKKITPVDGEDLAAVEKFYAANHPPEADYRIRSLQTLLNNWNRAVDQARRHSPKKEYNL